MKEVLDGIKSIGEKVDTIKAENEKAATDLQAKVKNATDEIELLKAAQEKQVSKEDFVKQMDELESNFIKAGKGGSNPANFGDNLEKALSEKAADLLKVKNGELSEASIAVKDINSGSFTFTGTQLNPSISTQHVGLIPNNTVPHVRNYISTGTTDSAAIYYAQEATWTPKAGYQAGEGAAKPKISATFNTKIAQVATIAAIIKVPRQTLDDVKFLRSYISATAPEKLLQFEDAELLYGDGAANHLLGLMTATTQTATGANLYEKLLNGFKVLATAANPSIANKAFINAGDYYDALGLKGTDGHYLFPQNMVNGGNIYVAGVPVIPITQMAAGDLIAGDFTTGAQLFIREGLNVRFFEQNVDDVEKNMITIRVEERIALPIYKPNAFVKVDEV